MISANAAVSPKRPTGAPSMPARPSGAGGSVRLPRPLYPWRSDADGALWTDRGSPCALNGTRRVSPFGLTEHRPISAGSAPDSNPAKTGWRCIGCGLTGAKPDVSEWAVFGGNRNCFWTPAALSRAPAAGAAFPRPSAGSLPDGCLAGLPFGASMPNRSPAIGSRN